MATDIGNIHSSVGQNGNNEAEDVRVVQGWLRAVGAQPYVEQTGLVDEATIIAIKDTQLSWRLMPSGIVTPGSLSHKQLIGMSGPIKLNRVEKTSLRNGWFKISYTGMLPPENYCMNLYLNLEIPRNCSYVLPENRIDISACSKENVFRNHQDKLIQFLSLIERGRLWETEAQLRVYLTRNGGVVSASNPTALPCPVKPFEGRITPTFPYHDAEPMNYIASIGEGGKMVFEGRLLEPLAGKYYFIRGGKLECERSKRGFDCITYVGTVLGADRHSSYPYQHGDTMAVHLHSIGAAEKTGLDKVPTTEIIAYVNANKSTTFFAWSGGHTVLIVQGRVHEFNIPIGEPGYRQHDAESYFGRFRRKKWSLRKVNRTL
jgi:hypothetical protein